MCNNAIMDTTRAAIITDVPQIANEELKAITFEIFDLGFNMRLVAKKIASKVAYVRDNADSLCGEFDGKTASKRFETWGTEILGLKRAQLNAFAKVGTELLDESGNVRILEHKPQHADVQDFTMTQLQTIVPLGIDKVNELVYDSKISPEMTVAEIKEVIKENDPKKAEKDAAAKKRQAKKAEKDAEAQRVHGELIATIKLNKLGNGSFVVTLNGEDITVTNIGRYVIKNLAK